jgi:hypothetical protein
MDARPSLLILARYDLGAKRMFHREPRAECKCKEFGRK